MGKGIQLHQQRVQVGGADHLHDAEKQASWTEEWRQTVPLALRLLHLLLLFQHGVAFAAPAASDAGPHTVLPRRRDQYNSGIGAFHEKKWRRASLGLLPSWGRHRDKDTQSRTDWDGAKSLEVRGQFHDVMEMSKLTIMVLQQIIVLALTLLR
eukprot:1139477-Pelagomonas_calceolata.AAC.1